MARQKPPPTPTGRTILVIDDNREYLVAAERLLKRAGHEVIAVDNPKVALDLLRREGPFDLVFVDYFMPEMTGEQLVAELRTFDPLVHVVLQTGYASEADPRDLLRRLDIQGYYDKSEGPDKLLFWAEVGLRGAHTVQSIERERRALWAVLAWGAGLPACKSANSLFSTILDGVRSVVAALLAPSGGGPGAKLPDMHVATPDEAGHLVVRAGTGRFEPQRGDRVEPALDEERGPGAQIVGEGTIIPIFMGGVRLGILYLDQPVRETRYRRLLDAFADQIGLALHCSRDRDARLSQADTAQFPS